MTGTNSPAEMMRPSGVTSGPRLFLVAGEPSGDRLGAALMAGLFLARKSRDGGLARAAHEEEETLEKIIK